MSLRAEDGFCEDSHNPKSPLVPYCSCNIIVHITINLLDEEARDPETPRTAQRNTRRNAEGARGDGRNKNDNNQPAREHKTKHTHLGGEGGWGSKGSRRGRRRGMKRGSCLLLDDAPPFRWAFFWGSLTHNGQNITTMTPSIVLDPLPPGGKTSHGIQAVITVPMSTGR